MRPLHLSILFTVNNQDKVNTKSTKRSLEDAALLVLNSSKPTIQLLAKQRKLDKSHDKKTPTPTSTPNLTGTSKIQDQEENFCAPESKKYMNDSVFTMDHKAFFAHIPTPRLCNISNYCIRTIKNKARTLQNILNFQSSNDRALKSKILKQLCELEEDSNHSSKPPQNY